MADSKNNWHDAGRNCRSYLLRCWQEEEPGKSFAWRFALVPINDESRMKGFTCLEALCASLREELEAEALNY